MTSETNKLLNDPNFVVQFAVGDPFPALIPQSPNEGLHFAGQFFKEPKRYVLKKAHLSRDDYRIFDFPSGKLKYNAHHPGKNPYAAADPLGLTNQDAQYTWNTLGAEWESICDVTGHGHGYPSFKIRPKKLSRHGRQFVKSWDGKTLFNIGKIGKFKSMSMRPNFAVGKEEDDEHVWYSIVADMMGRTISITNEKNELVAVMTKTSKALIMNAAFGGGSESTIDIAPGVDCSFILSVIFGLQQVGAHFAADIFNSYVMDPVKGAAVDSVVDATGLQGVVGGYTDASNQMMHTAGQLTRMARFINDNFFQ